MGFALVNRDGAIAMTISSTMMMPETMKTGRRLRSCQAFAHRLLACSFLGSDGSGALPLWRATSSCAA